MNSGRQGKQAQEPNKKILEGNCFFMRKTMNYLQSDHLTFLMKIGNIIDRINEEVQSK